MNTLKQFFTNPLTYIVIIILLLIIFRKQIAAWWNGDNSSPADGTPCKSAGSSVNDGHFKNKVCVKDTVQNNPPPVVKKLKVIDQGGAYPGDFDAQGCLQQKQNAPVIPMGTLMDVLEIKPNYNNPCISPLTPTIVKTAQGWFSLSSGVVQLV